MTGYHVHKAPPIRRFTEAVRFWVMLIFAPTKAWALYVLERGLSLDRRVGRVYDAEAAAYRLNLDAAEVVALAEEELLTGTRDADGAWRFSITDLVQFLKREASR